MPLATCVPLPQRLQSQPIVFVRKPACSTGRANPAPHTACLCRAVQQVEWREGEERAAVCPTACPCHSGTTDCMSLGRCHLLRAHARVLWVHLLEDPVEAVLSSYHAHRKAMRPPPHAQWMDEITAAANGQQLLKQNIPRWLLDVVGLPAQSRLSLWQHLKVCGEAEYTEHTTHSDKQAA